MQKHVPVCGYVSFPERADPRPAPPPATCALALRGGRVGGADIPPGFPFIHPLVSAFIGARCGLAALGERPTLPPGTVHPAREARR